MKLLTEKEIDELTANYPLYSQDGKGTDAVISYHFFVDSWDWYVLEGVRAGENVTLYGIARLNDFPEYGYFSLSKLEKLRVPTQIKTFMGETITGYASVEKDKYFEPVQIKDLDDDHVKEWAKDLFTKK